MDIGLFRTAPATVARSKDNLFIWTVFLLVLVGVAFACWLGSFYVFGHPEEPRPYSILKKLGKLPPPGRFQVTKAPAGEFLDAQRLFERYSKFTALQLERENQIYLRNYIKNYSETKKLVPYIVGKYVILKVYELHESDFFTTGVVALTQSVDFPQVLVELIYTAPVENVSDLKAMLKPGVEVRLDRTLDLSAVVHVARAVDGRVQLSVVPLLYGQYRLKEGAGEFSLEPPVQLKVASGLPLIRNEEVRSVFREQAELRKKRPGNSVLQADLSGSELVRSDPPKDALPAVGNLPQSAAVQEQTVPMAQSPDLSSAVLDANAKPPTIGDQSTPVPVAFPDGFVPQKVQIAAAASPPKAVSSPQVDKVQSAKIQDTGELDSPAEGSRPSPTEIKPDLKVAGKPMVKTDSKLPKETAQPAPPSGGVVAEKTAKVAAQTSGGGKDAEVSGAPSALKMETSNPDVPAAKSASKSSVAPDLKDRFVAAAGYPKPAQTLGPQAAAPVSVAALTPNATTPRPVIVATPSLAAGAQSANWKTYASGKQPQGRSVSTDQALALQGRSESTPNYLRGKFVVTAVDRNRAVMRQESSDPKAPPARVIVEYPPGALPPSQGSAISREDGRGFEIREVRRGADGQVNIFVREVIAP
jgi:hypothetical protein